MRQKILFIVNPFSGVSNKDNFTSQLEQYLDKNRFESKVIFSEYPMHANEIAKTEQNKHDIIIAVGGDGTINEVASAMLYTETKFGIIPMGSGNGLAMHLEIKRTISDSCKIINALKTKRIDACVVNGLPFFNVSGIGFDAYVAHKTKFNESRGILPYIMESLKNSIDFKPFDVRLEFESNVIDTKTINIIVANGSMYGYNFSISPDSNLSDGLFEIIVVKDTSLLNYFTHSYRLINKTIDQSPFIDTYKAKSLEIQLNNKNYLHIDGEAHDISDTVRYELAEKAIELIIP